MVYTETWGTLLCFSTTSCIIYIFYSGELWQASGGYRQSWRELRWSACCTQPKMTKNIWTKTVEIIINTGTTLNLSQIILSHGSLNWCWFTIPPQKKRRSLRGWIWLTGLSSHTLYSLVELPWQNSRVHACIFLIKAEFCVRFLVGPSNLDIVVNQLLYNDFI